jgi:hypothetical protein
MPPTEREGKLRKVGRDKPGKGDGKVEPHCQLAPAVIRETVDLLVRFTSALAQEDLGEFEHRCIDGGVAEQAEGLRQALDDRQPLRLLVGEEIAETLGNPWLDELLHSERSFR